MNRSFFRGDLGFVFLAMALVLVFSGCATFQPGQTSTKTAGSPPPAESAQPAGQCARIEISPIVIPYYPPPETIDLCGEPVPLNNQEVLERFDREFTIVVYNHAQVYLWLKRMERYFPWLEQQLRAQQLPDDLKYVAVVESDLLPNACSPKGAAGPWQFMPATGCYYGLEQKGTCDTRYDFEHASFSALRYLGDLNKKFKNWALAIAAYNCGEGRVRDEMRSQKVSDYYSLKLPQETERYVFRILALKAVLSNPDKYGYNFPKGQGYPAFKVDKTNVTVSSSIPIQSAAAAAGTTVREFKRLNPSFRADEIPAGTHVVKIPEGSGQSFEQGLQGVKARPVSDDAPQPKVKAAQAGAEAVRAKPEAAAKSKAKPAAIRSHLVKKGETLSGIARQYKVGAAEIRKANHLKGDAITPGQKLTIP